MNEIKTFVLGILDAVSKVKVLKNKPKEILPLIDFFQEKNHRLTESLVSLHEIIKSIETIRKHRKNIKDLYSNNDVIFVNGEFCNEGKVIKIENLTVDDMIGCLVRSLEIPNTIII